jgi:sugar phosphate isomerase/epimerase
MFRSFFRHSVLLSRAGALIAAVLLSSAAAQASWPLFAMDNGVGRGAWSAERQASVLKELGYDGISYNHTRAADVSAWRGELDARGLRLYGLYFPARLDREAALPADLAEAVTLLRGSGAVLWLVIPNPAQPGDYEARAVGVIREAADLAASAGLRVALYPHKDSYPATAEQALALVLRAERTNVGLTVNLAHELAAGNGPRLPGILRRVAPLLDLVTLNGATDKPGEGWNHRIQLLGQGDYNVAALLQVLREIHYTGPIGVQFYNVKGDPYENLAATRRAWQVLTADASER